ncbi:MAG: hypothetical protein EZS28_017849 [Streblomastix strix]|uniref:RRM domain-containing protein n=1 Tax=Streblomastix strix TaxID=222440 RepID=A0A5J4VVN1_9EUKA|nr:MAG: hypothetical protein EZS28_017849 [Streblomastix strix]
MRPRSNVQVENPSRTLFIRNIPSSIPIKEIVTLFALFGPIRSYCDDWKNDFYFVLISFYDIRDAVVAQRSMDGYSFDQNFRLKNRRQIISGGGAGTTNSASSFPSFIPPAATETPQRIFELPISVYIETHPLFPPYNGLIVLFSPAQIPPPESQQRFNGELVDNNEMHATLVIFNLDESVSDEILYQQFVRYGSIREIRSTPLRMTHRFVEFNDVRYAKNALLSENGRDIIRGRTMKIEYARPGGMRKERVQPLDYEMRLLGLEGIQGNNLTFEQTSGLRNFADANIYEAIISNYFQYFLKSSYSAPVRSVVNVTFQ